MSRLRPALPADIDDLDDGALMPIAWVETMTGLAGGTIRNRAHLGTFPAARPHADGGVRWQLGEVRQWLARRDQAHSKSEYKRRVSMGDTRVLPPQSKADPEGSAQTGPGRGLEGP